MELVESLARIRELADKVMVDFDFWRRNGGMGNVPVPLRSLLIAIGDATGGWPQPPTVVATFRSVHVITHAAGCPQASEFPLDGKCVECGAKVQLEETTEVFDPPEAAPPRLQTSEHA